MMRLLGIFAAVAVMYVHGADGLPAWSGEELRKGWGHNQSVLSYGPEGLTADSRGRDPFIVTPQFNLEKPSNLHEVVFRAKTAAPSSPTPTCNGDRGALADGIAMRVTKM